MWFGVLGIGIGGFLLKVVDWSGDIVTSQGDHIKLQLIGIFSAGLCGILLSLVSTLEDGFFVIILGVILGVLLAGKVDNLYLLFGLIVMILSWIGLSGGIPIKDVSFLSIFVIAFGGLIDELGNNLADKGMVHGLTGSLFQYRGILKILVVALWILGMVSVWGAIGLWAFDIGYLISELLLNRYGQTYG